VCVWACGRGFKIVFVRACEVGVCEEVGWSVNGSMCGSVCVKKCIGEWV